MAIEHFDGTQALAQAKNLMAQADAKNRFVVCGNFLDK
jgi:hypothetical protein